MILGRFIIGISSEAISFAVLTGVLNEFKNNNPTLASTVVIISQRIGFILNNYLTPYFSILYGLDAAL